MQIMEDRLFNDLEPAPVDRLAEQVDATLFLIFVEQVDILRPREEAGGLSHHLAGRNLARGGRFELRLGRAIRCGAEAEAHRHPLIRYQRGQPVNVGIADPAARGVKALRALVLYRVVVDVIIDDAAIRRDRAGMDRPGIDVLARAIAIEIAITGRRNRLLPQVRDLLADGEHIAVID